jgi:uncharacterized MAPEG superfamily protein
MTLEFKMLALSIVLGLTQILLASHAASLQRGYTWTASARDEAVPTLTGLAGRLDRIGLTIWMTIGLTARLGGSVYRNSCRREIK